MTFKVVVLVLVAMMAISVYVPEEQLQSEAAIVLSEQSSQYESNKTVIFTKVLQFQLPGGVVMNVSDQFQISLNSAPKSGSKSTDDYESDPLEDSMENEFAPQSLFPVKFQSFKVQGSKFEDEDANEDGDVRVVPLNSQDFEYRLKRSLQHSRLASKSNSLPVSDSVDTLFKSKETSNKKSSSDQ